MSPVILMVDDHDVVRVALRCWITLNFPEACILEADTGEEALTLATRHHPDIVLMDISLPGISGLEATRRIKATEPLTQVVMVTSHDAPEYRREAEAAGASAYAVKTRLGVELISILDGMLSHSSSPTVAKLE